MSSGGAAEASLCLWSTRDGRPHHTPTLHCPPLPGDLSTPSITFPLLSYLPLLPSLSYLTCLYYLPSLILPASIIFPLFWNGATMPSTTLWTSAQPTQPSLTQFHQPTPLTTLSRSTLSLHPLLSLQALELCNEPTAKACRLCRIRR